MPFDQLTPRPFSNMGVQMYAPTTSGIYGLSNAHEWIYIGAADNIRGALLNHLTETNAAVMTHKPTGFVYEVCDHTRQTGRHDRLILEYGPACNRRASRHG